jgi:hypothetical protein
VADSNGDIWVAHSILNGGQATVGHILNDGTYIGNVFLASGAGPTGVAVDAAGKIWATGYYSRKVYRIDPTAGPIGADGITPIGAVDFTSVDLGGNLYNYSDMTGSTLIGAPDNGTWTVVYDSGVIDEQWGTASWTAAEPGDSLIGVSVASSTDGTTFTPEVSVTNGNAFIVADGRYLRASVSFARSTTTDADGDGTNDTPILYDLTLATALIEVSVDIKPQSCPNPLRVNFRGKGVLPVAILGSENFDVLDIDVDTITLEGVAPLRSSVGDVSTPFEGEDCDCGTDGPDGIPDLTLKFDRQEILTALEATYDDLTELPNRTELAVILFAKTNGGTLVSGQDCLRLLNRGSNKPKK